MDATPFLPSPSAGKRKLAVAVQECRGCPLWRGATQAVFGEGPLKASRGLRDTLVADLRVIARQ